MDISQIKIRPATLADADVIYEMGSKEESFAVSPKARFYEEDDLRNWIENPGRDILLVAEIENEIVGFLFCRIIRNSWAMLDNILVSALRRKQRVGTHLLQKCLDLLKHKGIRYVGAIAREGNDLEFFINKGGFESGYKFIWIEKYL